MRNAVLATGLVLCVLLPARTAEEPQADEDPWIGKTRAEVVELLGKPQKAKRSKGGEKLTYKFLRLDPSAEARLDVRLLSVPGVGIVAQSLKLGTGSGAQLRSGPTEFDEHGATGGQISAEESVTTTYDSKTGKFERTDSEASTGLGKVKLHLVLDEQGRVAEWSVSGKTK